jgi:hypothetical protein
MKVYILFFYFLLSSFISFSQKKIVLTRDSVSITYVIKEDSTFFFETIQIYNLSHQAIYVPEIQNRGLYFFVLNKTLHSYFGVMASKLGTPNLSLDVKLIKIPPSEKFEYSHNISKVGSGLKFYYFSFDYLKDSDLNKKQRDDLVISMENYATLYKYVVSYIE